VSDGEGFFSELLQFWGFRKQGRYQLVNIFLNVEEVCKNDVLILVLSLASEDLRFIDSG